MLHFAVDASPSSSPLLHHVPALAMELDVSKLMPMLLWGQNFLLYTLMKGLRSTLMSSLMLRSMQRFSMLLKRALCNCEKKVQVVDVLSTLERRRGRVSPFSYFQMRMFSWNINGLNDPLKQRVVLTFLWGLIT